MAGLVNLNTKYNFLIKNEMVKLPIDIMKDYIHTLDLEDSKNLLRMCPVLVIPKNTILFHSNMYTCDELTAKVAEFNGLQNYPLP